MSCVSKGKSGNWSSENCKITYYDEETLQHSCFCNKLEPTTIVDDLEELIKNKNINTVFSSDGIENIFSFKEFYKYVVFWMLLLETSIFAFLYYKSYALDQADTKEKLEKFKAFYEKEEEQVIKKRERSKNKIIPLDSASFSYMKES